MIFEVLRQTTSISKHFFRLKMSLNSIDPKLKAQIMQLVAILLLFSLLNTATELFDQLENSYIQ